MSEQLLNVRISRHPLVENKLNAMRRATCLPQTFRRLVREVSMLLTYELMSDLPTCLPWKRTEIVTPEAKFENARVIGGHPPVIVPILRAGLAVAEGVQAILPSVNFGHIGIHREEGTFEVIDYLVKLPAKEDRLFVICDIMIATGNTAKHAIKLLKNYGIDNENIRVLSILSSFRGINRLHQEYPSISFYTGAVDGVSEGENKDGLNSRGHITPGLGDAGDRLFGTLPHDFDAHQEVDG